MSEARIGLFGGTFNPIHLGHLRGAEEVRELCDLQEVIFIPAALPPHKEGEKITEAHHRLEMVRLAIRSNAFFRCSDVEIKRPGMSYTIETLRYFRESRQGALFFILGADAFLEIGTWKEFQDLFSLSHFVVMTRPGLDRMSLRARLGTALTSAFRSHSDDEDWIHASGMRLCFREINFLDISSTKVRERVKRGRSIKYLVPPEVEAYIQHHGLYQSSAD